jgi:hypothetical protein
MTQRPTWLGSFYGGSLGFLNYEVLSIQNIPQKDLAKEAELMSVKWFDYRRLHPMQATYYFVKCYTDAYRDFCRKAINAETAPYVRAIKQHDFLEAKEKLSFWRMRQLCDRMGMRYDFFLSFAMSWLHKMIGDGKVYPPRPSQIMNNEDLIASAMLAWEEQCQVSMQVASDLYYRVSNFTGSRDQQAHEAFVIGQVKSRNVPQYSLHAALYLYDVVRVEEALRHFDARVVNMAINEVRLPD